MLSHRHSQNGFTLIELSIVLVIIGLIIGGVLVGQDMIKNAEIRATIGQVERYNAAVNTFRNKYGGIPGDIHGIIEVNFGFISRTNAANHGDGDGIIEDCAGGAIRLGCETAMFWADLSFADLIEGSFTTAADGDTLYPSLTAAEIPLYIPAAKLGRGNYVFASGISGSNYYHVGGAVGTGAGSGLSVREYMTPLEAQNIDLKLDDGLPTTGSAIATEGSANPNVPAVPGVPDEGVCVSNALTPNPYNTGASNYANSPACQIRIRFN